jgi:hypothetical protein
MKQTSNADKLTVQVETLESFMKPLIPDSPTGSQSKQSSIPANEHSNSQLPIIPESSAGMKRTPMSPTHTAEINPSEIICEQRIGQGTFGIVYKGLYRSQIVAIKKLKIDISDKNILDSFVQEINMLYSIRNNRLIQIYGACSNPDEPFIVTEYCSKGKNQDTMKRIQIKIL